MLLVPVSEQVIMFLIPQSPTSPVTYGQPVTVTAQLTPTEAPGRIGTRTTVGSTALVDGVATFTGALPGFGGYQLEANYVSTGAGYLETTKLTSLIHSRATPGAIVVSKWHPSGLGDLDWFVELANTAALPVPLAGVTVDLGGNPVVLPAASVAPGRRYVIAGAGGAFAAAADQVVSLPSGSGVRLVAPDAFEQTPATVLDTVGTDAGPHLGTALAAFTSASVPAGSAWVRNRTAAGWSDTGQNAADFQLVSTDGTPVGGLPAVAGNAGPTGAGDTLTTTASTTTSGLLDPSVAASAPPNRVVVPGSGSTPTRLVINRVITNSTGRALTSMALQVNSLSQPNAPVPSGVTGQVAWLRPVSPDTATADVLVGGRTVTVPRLPVAADTGAGLGSLFTVPLPEGGLAPGASVPVQLTFVVDRPGRFWFSYLAMSA